MKQVSMIALLLVLSMPGFAKTHNDTYKMPCNTLWPAIKDALRNSGKYQILGINNEELTASYLLGVFGNKRINSVVLNAKGDSCEMQVQTAFSGLMNDDYGDFKIRVQQSLNKLQLASESPTPAPSPSSTEAVRK